MNTTIRLFASGFVLSLASLLLPPPSALAHEHRHVGPYELTVGFIAEPALQNEPNGIDLRVANHGGEPVEGAEKTLKATVAFGGGQPREIPLRTRFRMPGSYTADLVPTRAGSYVFTFTGDINGQPVNERFESGPGRFNDVIVASYFPVADPSAAELQQSLNEARQQAATASTLATAGLVLGALSLALAGYLVLARRGTTGNLAMSPQGSRAD